VRLGYELFDFVFPGGIVSKIAKINRFVYCQDEEVIAIEEKFRFTVPVPVIVLAGARNSDRGILFRFIQKSSQVNGWVSPRSLQNRFCDY
jgi:hypothetical protein